MRVITVTANDGYDLWEAYNRVLDGELGDMVDLDQVKAETAHGGGVFGSAGERIPKFWITLKTPKSQEELEEIQAKLRQMFGSDAHIHTQS